MNKSKIYTTKRLLLRPLEREDAKLLSDFLIKNRVAHQPFEPLQDETYFHEDFLVNQVVFEYGKIVREEMLRLYLFDKNNPKVIIGMMNFNVIVRGVFQSCFLGYKIDKDFEGKGLMKEALLKGIEIMFKDYKLHRIEANIMPNNIRSIRLISSLGFVYEGLSKKYLKINGKWEDHRHYALLNSEVE